MLFPDFFSPHACYAVFSLPALCQYVLSAVPEHSEPFPMKVQATGGHPAKRTFQAIRIELNHELEVLQDNLDTMIDLLNPGGRICIITFHSLEDRIVKTNFKRNENPCTCPSDFPVCVCGKKSKGRVITRKPVLPGERELAESRMYPFLAYTEILLRRLHPLCFHRQAYK